MPRAPSGCKDSYCVGPNATWLATPSTASCACSAYPFTTSGARSLALSRCSLGEVEPVKENQTAAGPALRDNRTTPVWEAGATRPCRMPAWEKSESLLKSKIQPTRSQRYNPSAVIWVQNTMAVREKPSKCYDGTPGQSTIRIKSVTDERRNRS